MFLFITFYFADLFLLFFEAIFIQVFLKKNEKKLMRTFNFTFRYIDEDLSLNNCKFGDFNCWSHISN